MGVKELPTNRDNLRKGTKRGWGLEPNRFLARLWCYTSLSMLSLSPPELPHLFPIRPQASLVLRMAGQWFWFRLVIREQIRPCISLAVLSQEVCTGSPMGSEAKVN